MKGDPQSGPLEKLHIDSEEAATTEVRPFLREVCSFLGQGPSICTLSSGSALQESPLPLSLPVRNWGLGLQISEGKSFLFTCHPDGFAVGCATETLCPS